MPGPWRRIRDAGRSYVHRATNSAIGAWHRPDVDPAAPIPHPPVFIIGAPRSGTTVLYQLLVDRYRLAYFANIHCRWYGAPDKAEARHHPWAHNPQGDYGSSYGRTKGAFGPSECGEFWYRFFPRHPQAVTMEDVDALRMRRMRRAVGALVREADRPFLFKNLPCSLRLLPLAHHLPEALFIVVHRSELEVGESLLEGRLRLHGDLGHWFSLEPPGWKDLLDRPPEEQVIEQARKTYATIDAHARTIGADRFHHLDYAALCADVEDTLRGVAAFLAIHGAPPEDKGDVPRHLEKRAEARIDPALHERMAAYAEASAR